MMKLDTASPSFPSSHRLQVYCVRGFYVLALLLTSVAAFFANTKIEPIHLMLFIPPALFLVVPGKAEGLLILRKIVALYLLFLLTDQASAFYFEWAFLSHRLYLSASLPILMFSFVAFGLSRSKMLLQSSGFKSAWGATLILLSLLSFFLLVLLQSFYGYGWQHSFEVLGRFIFFLFLFSSFWPLLHVFWFRLFLTAMVLINFFLFNLSGVIG